jgi:hypothetical protein
MFVFIAAPLTIAKLENQPRCPSTVEWEEKIWCIQIIEYWLAIKKNEIMPFIGKWMEMEDIYVTKISQK